MRTGRPKRSLVLTADEQERLQSLAHRARSQPVLARRARVILASARGLAHEVVAKQVRCSVGMVNKWRSRFLKKRLEGLYDEPRPGAPRKVTDAKVEKLVIQTVARPSAHRESARRRGALPEPARSRGGLLRGREEPDSGAGPHATPPAHATRPGRAAHPRLQASRDNLAVCGAGIED